MCGAMVVVCGGHGGGVWLTWWCVVPWWWCVVPWWWCVVDMVVVCG